MAKALREPPPSSSIARLLDMGAAARAVAPQGQEVKTVELSRLGEAREGGKAGMPAFPHASLQPTGEPAHIKREFVLSPSTDEAFSQVVELFKRATGTRLSSSHVARALFKGLAQSMPSIEREARRMDRMKLPSNGRGREGERERFEDQIARILIEGIRSTGAYKPEG